MLGHFRSLSLSRRTEWIQGTVVHIRVPLLDPVLVHYTYQVSCLLDFLRIS